MLARLFCVYLAFVKTPISYPGGKSRAVKKLYEFVSDVQFDTYVEPFLGGGSFALYITQMRPDVKVVVNDAFRPLYCFWKILKDRPEELTKELYQKRQEVVSEQECRELFSLCHKMMGRKSTSNFDLAVSFYVVNKMSYGGVMNGVENFSRYNASKKFTEFAINKLTFCSEVIQNWVIKHKDYTEVTRKNSSENTLTYLDPPYDITHSTLYGKNAELHKSFDHQLFSEFCQSQMKSGVKLLVSYNQEMAECFPGWEASVFPLWYSMQTTSRYQSEQEQRLELVLKNF